MTDAAPWTPPPATDEQFRTAGYTPRAREFPLSEAGAHWLAASHGIPLERLPHAWCYAPNPFMQTFVENAAAAART